MSFLGRIGSAIGRFFSRAGSAPKLGQIQSGIQRLGQVAGVVQKLGIGGPTVQKIAGTISKLPTEDIAKTAQQAFDVGKQIIQTGKAVREAFNPQPQQQMPAEMAVRPVAMGNKQGVMNFEDL